MTRHDAVLLLAALPLLACELATAPALPAGAVRIQPPAVYAEWWKMTEECSALGGDFERLQWFQIPGVDKFSMGSLRDVQGAWYDDRIVIAGNFVRDGQLVRHEMLHALLKKGGHPRADFVGRCGGVVACLERCLEGQAPADDPRATLVQAAALEVSMTVFPASPGSDVLDGYAQMVVSVRNPAPGPVIVQLPASDGGPPATFKYRMQSSTSYRWWSERALVPEVTRFKPGEVKRYVFDYWIGTGDYPVNPGTYLCSGAFGDHWTAQPQTVTVRP